ncbi:MAG TPA: hypothetical protein VNA89_14250 [Gemmatimonadaceae bacterium]|nr:hypothetical protein [Gemmatimonadaceae bacterium]
MGAELHRVAIAHHRPRLQVHADPAEPCRRAAAAAGPAYERRDAAEEPALARLAGRVDGGRVGTAARLDSAEQLRQPPLEVARAGPVAPLADDAQRRRQPPLVEGLQEIVERVDGEGVERVTVVRGHEHHRRHSLGADGAHDGEAIELRHLHVEEDEVRGEAGDLCHRVGAVGTLADDLDVRLVREQRAEPAAGESFVVHDERAHRGHDPPSYAR